MVKVIEITCIPYSDIWSELELNLLTTSECVYAFIFWHMIGWLNTCINKLPIKIANWVYKPQMQTFYIGQKSHYFLRLRQLLLLCICRLDSNYKRHCNTVLYLRSDAFFDWTGSWTVKSSGTASRGSFLHLLLFMLEKKCTTIGNEDGRVRMKQIASKDLSTNQWGGDEAHTNKTTVIASVWIAVFIVPPHFCAPSALTPLMFSE